MNTPDRAKEEMFLHENRVAMTKLPLEDLNLEWLKNYLPSLKKKQDSIALSIHTFLNKKDISKVKFLES